MLESIRIIENLFNLHVVVKESSKIFNASNVNTELGENDYYAWGCQVSHSPTRLITYKDDGVDIRYYKRMTTYLGDTDCFIDYHVIVDDKEIVKVEYGW